MTGMLGCAGTRDRLELSKAGAASRMRPSPQLAEAAGAWPLSSLLAAGGGADVGAGRQHARSIIPALRFRREAGFAPGSISELPPVAVGLLDLRAWGPQRRRLEPFAVIESASTVGRLFAAILRAPVAGADHNLSGIRRLFLWRRTAEPHHQQDRPPLAHSTSLPHKVAWSPTGCASQRQHEELENDG